MQTIAELPEFIRRVEKLLPARERQALISHLAENPKAGDLIRGTGGIRKMRWAKDGTGKSGGTRVIYYYHSNRIPLYLLTVFGKNEKANLTAAERNALAALVKLLIEAAGVKS